MDLVVFDLDGTLLNKQQQITQFTRDTLVMLKEQGVGYTVATGRTRHAAKNCIEGVDFSLPHVYKNGVLVWQPEQEAYSHQNLLSPEEIHDILQSFAEHGVTPFVFTLEEGGRHTVFHPAVQTDACRALLTELTENRGLTALPLSALPGDIGITNISALGAKEPAEAIHQALDDHDHLMAYIGGSMYNNSYSWIDIHHSEASKGGALEMIKSPLGVERIICFGDSDNDLSMFEMADEAYAPANALPEVKALATSVIEHHNDDGIARFLRERFSLS